MRNNPGRTRKIYDIPVLVNQASLSSMTPSSIVSGFNSTGICPLNINIFPDAEFIPSKLTDRPMPAAEALQTAARESNANERPLLVAEELQTVAPQPVQQHNLALTASDVLELVTGDADEVGAPAAFSGDGSEHTSHPVGILQSPSCSSTIRDANYIPPFAILLVPKAPPRKTRCNKRRRKTAILTDTPEKNIIQQRHVERQEKGNRKSPNKKKLSSSLKRWLFLAQRCK